MSRAARVTWDRYATVWAGLHGGVDPRRSRPSVIRWLRLGYHGAKVCARLRIRPAAVTVAGLVACLFVPVFAVHGAGGALIAAGCVVLAAIADTVDGALAVLTGHTTRLGYVYDSVVDRVAEVCWLLAFWRIGVPASVCVAAGAVTWLHEYARSRANAAGMTEISTVTIGERPTRVLFAVAGLGLAGLLGLANPDMPAGVATFAAAAWVVFALIGFVQLFAAVHRALAGRAWPSWPAGALAGTPLAAGTRPPGLSGPTNWEEVDDLDPDVREAFTRMASLPPSVTVYASGTASAGRHSAPDDLSAGDVPGNDPDGDDSGWAADAGDVLDFAADDYGEPGDAAATEASDAGRDHSER